MAVQRRTSWIPHTLVIGVESPILKQIVVKRQFLKTRYRLRTIVPQTN